MHFLIFGLKIVKNRLKTAKVSLNICGPHAGRKLSAPQQKQPKSVRAAAGRTACGESPQPEPREIYIIECAI
jgi:hypothetical protein